MSSSNKDSTNNDQHSYFYVVWPDESKSPRVCTSASNVASISTVMSSSTSVLASEAAASSTALCTSIPMSTSQPVIEDDREDSRHTSSSSSVQSRSPDQSPVQVLQQNLPVSSFHTKVPGPMDEIPRISSNGIRGPQPISVSLSPAGGVVATTTTYMIPSISNAHVRHTKTVVLPSDPSPARGNYGREPEVADSNLKEIGNLAKQAITKLQKIVSVSGSSVGSSSRKLDASLSAELLVSEDTPPPAKRPCSLSTTVQGNCLECEVKNAEINILRRRMQQLQEDLDLALSSNGNKPHSSPSFEEKYTTLTNKANIRQIPETIYISDSQQHISATTQQQQQQQQQSQQQLFQHQQQPSSLQQHLPQQQPRPLLPNPKATPIIPTDTRQQSQSPSTSSVKPSIEYVELIPGSDVYISSHKLEESTRDAKTGTQLARKLMDAFWDKDTLARSTLTPRSKFQYQQLDPKVIKTIEAYCLSYDSSLHSKDIHATMTDKCCQARSRYRTVTTSQLLYNPE